MIHHQKIDIFKRNVFGYLHVFRIQTRDSHQSDPANSLEGTFCRSLYRHEKNLRSLQCKGTPCVVHYKATAVDVTSIGRCPTRLNDLP